MTYSPSGLKRVARSQWRLAGEQGPGMRPPHVRALGHKRKLKHLLSAYVRITDCTALSKFVRLQQKRDILTSTRFRSAARFENEEKPNIVWVEFFGGRKEGETPDFQGGSR